MRWKIVIAAGLAGAALSAASMSKAADVPATAPATVLQSVIAGKVETYDLQKAAATRPVVLYFFPAAFTGGCTIEAQTFAAKLADFNKLGYDVVGISVDDIAKLTAFQKAENAGQRFVSDPGGVIAKAFGVAIQYQGTTYADRVTFVIGSNGAILFKVADEVPNTNVASTLAWVQAHPNVSSSSSSSSSSGSSR